MTIGKLIKTKTAAYIGLLLCTVLLSGCAAVQSAANAIQTAEKRTDDIIILYTADPHADANAGLGYAGVAAVKKKMLETSPYVLLADCGDHVQGTNFAAVSNGLYLIQIMNQAGYDLATFGNHEFDYGLEKTRINMQAAQFQYVCCNTTYTGKGEDPLAGCSPWLIRSFGETKVAFVGVDTPQTVTSAGAGIRENGEVVIDFHSASAREFYDCIQTSVDAARKEGADYVILLAHLGEAAVLEEFSSTSVIKNTQGIDVLLDGHSHNLFPEQVLLNKNGDAVIRSTAGTRLNALGQLIIEPSGRITTTLITMVPEKDAATQSYIDSIENAYKVEMDVVIGTSPVDVIAYNEKGDAIVRLKETGLGDLCADALRAHFDAKIGLKHAGGIRSNLPAGDVTRGNVLEVQPFNNDTVMIRASGQQILDALEMGARKAHNDSSSFVSIPGFLQVSGLQFEIDTTIPSGVVVDTTGNFVSIDGERRIKNVQVENEDGSLSRLDPAMDYAVAMPRGIAEGTTDGYSMFKEDEILSEGPMDYDILANFIQKNLSGVIPESYGAPQGRIMIR